MKVLLVTQLRENYGAHDWDGTGECPQYWKNKFGSTYEIATVSGPIDQTHSLICGPLSDKVAATVTRSDNFYQEFVVDHLIIEDDALTEYERSQLNLDGQIWDPRIILTVEQGYVQI